MNSWFEFTSRGPDSPVPSLGDVLSRFRGLKGADAGPWTAKCPAHEDHRNSLSIGTGSEGRVLLKCHAGCEVDAIVAGANLTMADLMPDRASGGAVTSYTYRLADGTPVFQVRRYVPKDFRQFRWENNDWVPKLLPTTPRVLYRLPDLQNQELVWIVEGEKDADRLARENIVATTKSGGAQNWLADYTVQLQTAGVKRAYCVPDNDEPGRKYMRHVVRVLELAGIKAALVELPDVPEKGDVSDYLSRHTVDDLVALTETPTCPIWEPRTFEMVGFGSYVLRLPHDVISFAIARLRRDRNELIGELIVRCSLPGAQTVKGVLSSGDFNLSSVQARGTRAKHLASRANLPDVDWEGWLHEFTLNVVEAERQGTPPSLLDDAPEVEEIPDFNIHGLLIPRSHPSILFGDGGSAKSMLALDVACQLACVGEIVLYCDWEADINDHARRLRKLYPDQRPPILYVRCERPLVHEADRLRTVCIEHGVTFTVMDSAAYGCAGAPEAAESALDYFRALRSLGKIGHFVVAHVNKSDDGDKRPFGSSFWHNSARATWHVKRSNPDDDGQMIYALVTPRKCNFGRLGSPLSLSINFGQTIQINRSSVLAAPEFGPSLTIGQRIWAVLSRQNMTRDDLKTELGQENWDTTRRTINRGLETGKLIAFQRADGIEVIGIMN